MNYTQFLRKSYKGKRMLRLGQSVELFLDSNLDPNIPSPINFNELSSALGGLVPQNSLSDIVCKLENSSKGQETYSIFDLQRRKKLLMTVNVNPSSLSFAFKSLNVPQEIAKGLMTIVFLSCKMRKTLAVRVFPNEIRIMS
jgi:hypothetical protein